MKYICLQCKTTKEESEALPTYDRKNKDGSTTQENYKIIISGEIINTHICCNHKMAIIPD